MAAAAAANISFAANVSAAGNISFAASLSSAVYVGGHGWGGVQGPRWSEESLDLDFFERREALLRRNQLEKQQAWTAFEHYLDSHRPPLALAECSGAHVLEFLLQHTGKTNLHAAWCPFYGAPPQAPRCRCPMGQTWGGLDALVGRLRNAFEEHGGDPYNSPFNARVVLLLLRYVRDSLNVLRPPTPKGPDKAIRAGDHTPKSKAKKWKRQLFCCLQPNNREEEKEDLH